MSLRRSQSVRSTPSWPGLALRGAWLVELLKRRLPQPPLPPRARSTRWPGTVEVGDEGLAVVVEDLGADGDAEDDVVGRLAGALLAHARLAVPGEEVLLVAVVDEGVEALDRLGPDVAALAAVAAVGAAELDELLAAEADAAVAAAAGADLDAGVVEELHVRRPLAGGQRNAPAAHACAAGQSIDSQRFLFAR